MRSSLPGQPARDRSQRHVRNPHADGIGHRITDRGADADGGRLAEPDDAALVVLRRISMWTTISPISPMPASL